MGYGILVGHPDPDGFENQRGFRVSGGPEDFESLDKGWWLMISFLVLRICNYVRASSFGL